MTIIDTLDAMRRNEEERLREQRERLALEISKKKILTQQKGRHFILDLLRKEKFDVDAVMKSEGTEISRLIVKLNDKELTLKVHTTLINQQGYPLGDRDEKNYDDKTFHVFVDFDVKGDTPDYWIIPSEWVAKSLESIHKKWEETLGLKGRPHSLTNDFRLFITNPKSDAEKSYRPDDWVEQVNKYYKKIEILREDKK